MEKLRKHNNLGLKILSVAIAILVWLLVTNTNDPLVTRRFAGIPVNVINEDALVDQGYAYNITEGDIVTVTIKGKDSIVSNLGTSDLTVTADLSKTTKWGAVPIDVAVGRYTEQLEISLGTINTMKIEMEESTTISIPVNVIVQGRVAKNYAIGSTSCTPNLITVSGPKSVLNDAKEIQAMVDVEGASKDLAKTCKPVLYDETGREIDNSQISFGDENIIATVQIWKTKEIMVHLQCEGSPKEGYKLRSFEYEPKRILVAAPDPMLNGLNAVTLEAISISDLDKNLEQNIDLREPGILPSHVVLADDTTQLKAKATIEKVVTKNIVIASRNLSIRNKGSYTVAFHGPEQYAVEIEGPQSLVKNVTARQLVPWIDLSECTGDMEGDHELKLHVKGLDGVVINSTPSVAITISK